MHIDDPRLPQADGQDDWTCSVVLLDLVKETACRPDSLSDSAVVGESESDQETDAKSSTDGKSYPIRCGGKCGSV